MIKSMNFAWWVKRWSELHPHKTAIIFEGNRISYLGLHCKINRACCWQPSRSVRFPSKYWITRLNPPPVIDKTLFLQNSWHTGHSRGTPGDHAGEGGCAPEIWPVWMRMGIFI